MTHTLIDTHSTPVESPFSLRFIILCGDKPSSAHSHVEYAQRALQGKDSGCKCLREVGA